MRGVLTTVTALLLMAASAWTQSRDGTFGPYIQNVTATSAVVCWVTSTSGTGTVQYGTTQSYGSTATQTTSVREHQVRLPGLTAGTLYFYRATGGGFTGTGSFRTASTGNAPFSFVAMGETHTEDEVGGFSEEVLAASPYCILDASDQVDNGLVRNEWDDFFTFGDAFYPRVPLFAAVGNHTYNTSAGIPLPGWLGKTMFRAVMNNPGNEEWFTARNGNTLVICLNSTWYLESPSRIFTTQRDWLDATLRAATDGVNDPTFKVVFMHVPLFSSGPLYREVLERIPLRSRFQPLFERYGVDLVLSGHDKMNEHSVRNGVNYAQVATGEIGYAYGTRNSSSLWRDRVNRMIFVGDVSATGLTCRYLDANGAERYRFTIAP